MSLRALERVAALRLLVLLYRKGKMSIHQLRNELEASGLAIYNSIEALKKVDLVHDEYEEHFPRRRLISLTPLGQKVAEHLIEIEKLLAKAEAGRGGEGS